jgi:nitrous oxide reductase
MKKVMLSLCLLIGTISASAAAPTPGECKDLGDEFCNSSIDHNHPSLKDGPWNYSYYHGKNWPLITRKALGLTNPLHMNECGGKN